ncbi:MAG TPA: hemolysin family protein [Acidobacteriota bacterium]|nr:hemolysin family protein [Acidobacteriota bacterium]
MTALVVTVSVAISISALCSLLEAVLYAVPDSHVESLVKSGRSGAQALQRLRSDIDRPIIAILSLNTISNTAGAAVAGAFAAAALGSEWLGLFSALFTLAILLFSEVIPKTVGVVHSRRLAPLVAWPLLVLVRVFAPLILFCGLATRLVTRGKPAATVSEEEILSVARLGLRAGAINKDEAEVIENILTLPSKTARQIMTPRAVVFSLSAQAPLLEVRRMKDIQQHSRIPVFDEGEKDIIGMVHRREILAHEDDLPNVTVRQLTRPVHFVSDTTLLDALLKMFLERRRHMFVVLNEFADFAGVVTLEDVLEEILGQEIVDESDQVEDLRQLARERRKKAIEK